MTPETRQLDTTELEERVKRMYEEVAREPERDFHFETGRALAERLGYPPSDLDRIPAEAIDSFAGVGYFLDLAGIEPGEAVLDLGSGSGMDSFLAALAAGSRRPRDLRARAASRMRSSAPGTSSGQPWRTAASTA
jgi:arsenite methyltransferase